MPRSVSATSGGVVGAARPAARSASVGRPSRPRRLGRGRRRRGRRSRGAETPSPTGPILLVADAFVGFPPPPRHRRLSTSRRSCARGFEITMTLGGAAAPTAGEDSTESEHRLATQRRHRRVLQTAPIPVARESGRLGKVRGVGRKRVESSRRRRTAEPEWGADATERGRPAEALRRRQHRRSLGEREEMAPATSESRTLEPLLKRSTRGVAPRAGGWTQRRGRFYKISTSYFRQVRRQARVQARVSGGAESVNWTGLVRFSGESWR